MAKDYYAMLEIPRHASTEDVCQAFRRLALLRHPARDPDQLLLFTDTAEAFEVLSNPRLRAEFDKGGYYGLRRAGYEFLGEPEKVFDGFFGTECFYDAALRFEKSLLEPISQLQPVARPPPADIHTTVEFELSAFFTGASAIAEFERNECVNGGVGKTCRKVTRLVEVAPGPLIRELLFRGEGHQEHGHPQANLVVHIKLLLAGGVRVTNDELIVTHELTLLSALLGKPFRMVFPDGETGMVPVQGTVSPATRVKVPGHGLPLAGSRRGDLTVEFRIIFPEFLTLEQKEKLKEIL